MIQLTEELTKNEVAHFLVKELQVGGGGGEVEEDHGGGLIVVMT